MDNVPRARRTKAAIQSIRDGLYEIVAADQPMTVRQVFYQAVSRGLVPKSEAAYKSTVGRLLVEMRRDGTLPYSWLADGTRWQRKPSTYTGLSAFIERHQRAYRRDLWAESDTYVEVWVEKEALAGTIYDVTAEYDVPLMPKWPFQTEPSCSPWVGLSELSMSRTIVRGGLCSCTRSIQAPNAR
jgi:hypothetical protein